MQGYRFNSKGNIIPTNVYIVWGSPASGKTTYVRENMTNGDMVVDLDLIKQSISMQNKTNTKDNLFNTAIGIRDYLYGLIEKREFTCDHVWVIASLPKAEDREKLKYKLNAETIHIDTDQQECNVRAMKDAERDDKELQYKLIEKWFRAFYYEDSPPIKK